MISRLLFPAGRKMVHTDRFFMPATTRVDYAFGLDRHFIITSQCTPVTEDETLVYTVMTFRFGHIAPLVRLLFEPIYGGFFVAVTFAGRSDGPAWQLWAVRAFIALFFCSFGSVTATSRRRARRIGRGSAGRRS